MAVYDVSYLDRTVDRYTSLAERNVAVCEQLRHLKDGRYIHVLFVNYFYLIDLFILNIHTEYLRVSALLSSICVSNFVLFIVIYPSIHPSIYLNN